VTGRPTITLDVPPVRADTSGVASVLHFNSAGAALPPRPVLDSATRYLARETEISAMEARVEAADHGAGSGAPKLPSPTAPVCLGYGVPRGPVPGR